MGYIALLLAEMSFPYLNVDLEQATMIIVAAAQQSVFFEEVSRNLSFWGGLAEACALIGFTAGVIGYLLGKIGIGHILSWFLVMFLLFVAPLNALNDGAKNSDTLFFTALTPQNYQWTRQPYPTARPSAAQPAHNSAGKSVPKTPLDDLKELEQIKKGKAVFLFSPQLVLIDVFNKIRAAVGGSFVGHNDAGYSAPLDRFAQQNRSALKPLAGISRVVFGNIAQGTYSALLPMSLTFIMVIVIVCTPFILMLALMVPHWGPSLLLFTVGGVVYVKTVEVMFAMVSGVLGLFMNTGAAGHSTAAMATAAMAPINEVLLGLGYLAALGASVWLVVKVRHTGKSLHSLLQEVVQESRDTSQKIQQKTAEGLAQGITSRSLKHVRSSSGAPNALQGGNLLSQMPAHLQALSPPQPQLGNRFSNIQSSLYSKTAFQKSAVRPETAQEAATDAHRNEHANAQSIAHAQQKIQQDALQHAQQQGVAKEASMPRAALGKDGQKTKTREPALTKVAKAFGGTTPEQLSQNYQTATQLFSAGALRMRTDDDNTLRVEVNLSLEVMANISPEMQSAVNQLQRDGFITRVIANGTPFFVLDETAS